MNIRRFVGSNARLALREVRDTLGADAIILANRPTGKGVEILAALPGELEELTDTRPRTVAPRQVVASPAAPTPAQQAPEPVGAGDPEWYNQAQVLRTRARAIAEANAPAVRAKSRPASPPIAAQVHAAHHTIAPLPGAREGDTQTREIANELRSMRGFMEEQLANFAWGDALRRSPARMRLLQDLISVGFSPALARHVQEHLPDDFSAKRSRDWVQQVLARNLQCGSPRDDLIDIGGVYALVGPTGVGKTTTTAKLAARFAVKYGVDQLALITTDGYRVGAQDQLRIYGSILGIQVHTIQDQSSLISAIEHLRHKRLVLIDTAGVGQRDVRVADQLAMLASARVQRLLVLNATVQGETLDDTVNAYAARDFRGCVITKIDEAVRLAPALDVVIRQRLKVHYVSNGQRVPEDLHHPNVAFLVHRALREAPVSKAYDLQPGDQPAWLAAIARAAREVGAAEMHHV